MPPASPASGASGSPAVRSGARAAFRVPRQPQRRQILGREAFTSVTDLPEASRARRHHRARGGRRGGSRRLARSRGQGHRPHQRRSRRDGRGGAARERAIVERVRAAGAVLVGPNCLGIHDSAAQLELCSEELEAGSIGLISQSGNLALEIGMVGAEFRLGFSRFVSLGNQADVQAAELIQAFAEHEPTQLIAVYLEDFRDGREFARRPGCRRGGDAGRASRGRSHRGQRPRRALAHRRAGQRPGLDPAACLGAGIELVASPKEVVDVPWACSPTGGRRGGGSPWRRTVAVTPSWLPTSSSPRASSFRSSPTRRAQSSPRRCRRRRRS